MGLGCWQFSEGKGLVGGYWPALPPDITREVVAKSLAAGVNWFDTAEAYGNGRSEHSLAAALRANGKQNGDVIVATKWWPMFRTAASIRDTIDTRLACLEGFGIDLHQVHQTVGLSSVEAEMDAMAALVAQKKIRAVGVSNFDAARMRRAHAALARHGLPLASNQMKYSLLDRRIESSGVMAAAKELGVTIIAYSPLEQGLVTGKFHDDPSRLKSLSPGRRFALTRRGLEKSRPLVDVLRAIASARDVGPAQVALAWMTRFHGDTVVVIPGATSARQAELNAGSMDLALTPDELRRIDEASRGFI